MLSTLRVTDGEYGNIFDNNPTHSRNGCSIDANYSKILAPTEIWEDTGVSLSGMKKDTKNNNSDPDIKNADADFIILECSTRTLAKSQS